MFYKYIAYLCVHACVCTQGSEKSIRSFKAGIYRMSSLLCGCWDPNSDTPDLSSHQPCLVLCFEFFLPFNSFFLKKNNMCVSVWVYTLEGRCPQKPEASDLPAAAIVGICELPDMGTGN